MDKSAKELFDELGYEKTKTRLYLGFESLSYKKDIYGSLVEIIFDEHEKRVCLSVDYYYGCDIDVPTLKAINKQVEELGWIE